MSIVGRKPLGTICYLGGLPAVLEQFCWAWSQMIQFNCEVLDNATQYVHYARTTYSLHQAARNDLAARFLGDWILMMDTDHNFEPDIVVRLLRLQAELEYDLETPVDVLTAVYQYKGPPHLPLLYLWKDVDGLDHPMPQPLASFDREAKAIEIGSAGGGCLLIRRSVFDRIAAADHGAPFDKFGPFGEDHSFFYRCYKLGIKCYAATQIQSPHMTIRTITLDDLDTEIASEPQQVAGAR